MYIIIFFSAFILRIIYLLQLHNADPLFYHPIMDALYHHDWAVSIIKGGWLGKDAFFRAPLYPYSLSLLYRICGVNLLIPRVVQCVIGALNCVLIQRIGIKIFDKKIGNIAGLFAAFYPLFIYFDLELLIPSLLIFFILLGFYLILVQIHRGGIKSAWFITGAVWGLATITRPNVVFFLPFLSFWLAKKMGKHAQIALLYGSLGVAAMIIPVTIRNYVVSREFVPIAWQGGTNFYIGNNQYSDGMTAIIPGTRKSWWGGFYDAKRIAEEAVGRELKNSEIDRYWFTQGLAFITQEPIKAGLLFLRKIYLFFGGFEISNNRDIYFYTQLTYLKFLIINLPFFQFPFGLLFPLSLVGLWYAYKTKKGISLILVFIIPYALSFIIFFVCARYRLGIIPFLIILASFAVQSIISIIREKEYHKIIPAVLIFIPTFIFFNANIFHIGSINPGQNYLTLAGVEYDRGHYQKAISLSEKTLRYTPHYPEALVLLGSSYKKLGKQEKALFYYEEAIKYDPKQPEPYFNIGNIYAETGKYEEAKDFYLKAIAVDPYSARAYNNLGNISFSMGNYKEALAYYRKASTLEPRYTSPLYHAGLAEMKMGNIMKAESLWKKVLEIEPEHRGAQKALMTFIR